MRKQSRDLRCAGCGTWHASSLFTTILLTSEEKDSKEDCLAACAEEACNAVTFRLSTKECQYFLASEEATMLVNADYVTFRVCEPGTNRHSICFALQCVLLKLIKLTLV